MATSAEDRRIACLWVPDFRRRVHERDRPELEGTVFAVLAPDEGGLRGAARTTARAIAVSPAASALGIRPGMTRIEVLAISPGTILVEGPAIRYEEAFGGILTALERLSPAVERAELGLAYVGACGVRALFGSEAGFLEALRSAAADAGFGGARAALASSRFTARAAALYGAVRACPEPSRRACPERSRGVVPAGVEASFLASLPIRALAGVEGAEPEDLEALALVGLRTLGEVARLPAGSLERRFGARGALYRRLSVGDDPMPIAPARASATEAVAAALAGEAGLFDLVRRLASRLAGRGLACGLLRVRAPAPRDIRPAEPTADPRALFELARLGLGRAPAKGGPALGSEASVGAESEGGGEAEVEVVLEAVETVPERTRTDATLFGARARFEVQPLARTLARVEAAVGASGSASAFEVVDAHAPERAFRPVPFGPRAGPAQGFFGEAGPKSPGGTRGVSPLKSRNRHATGLPPSLAPVLRLVEPPRPANVEVEPGTDRIRRFRAGEVGGAVRTQSGPTRLAAEWWEKGFARDYYVVALPDDSLFRLFRDLAGPSPGGTSWYLCGIYD